MRIEFDFSLFLFSFVTSWFPVFNMGVLFIQYPTTDSYIACGKCSTPIGKWAEILLQSSLISIDRGSGKTVRRWKCDAILALQENHEYDARNSKTRQQAIHFSFCQSTSSDNHCNFLYCRCMLYQFPFIYRYFQSIKMNRLVSRYKLRFM